MTKKNKIKLAIFLIIDALLVGFSIWMAARPSLHFGKLILLNPQGIIAHQQKSLIITATLVMLIIVAPVYFLLFFFAKKYRADKNYETNTPEQSNKLAVFLLWLAPISIIFIIACLILKSTPELDPYKPIESKIKPLTIQVVALRWKWLFIYPEQNIATVNFIEFPEGTPLNFELTSDGPMNTFWIPQLGGQIYVMAGMETKLHLMADNTGEFNGQTSEISGKGFAGMRFMAKSTSKADFDQWVKSTKQLPTMLHEDQYKELLTPSENNPQTSYSMVEKGLFDNIIMKYMEPNK